MKSTDEAQSDDIAGTAPVAAPAVMRLAVIIPAYRPAGTLIDLVAALSAKRFAAIVLVDDGSGEDSGGMFEQAAGFDNVRVVRHAVNLGRGAALKTGINYALCNYPDLQGAITADVDSAAGDILLVADRLAGSPDRMVVGTCGRSARAWRPARRETGVRGIPVRLLSHLLRLEANGGDFDVDVLTAAKQQALEIAKAPVGAGGGTGFDPLMDSLRMPFVLARFGATSITTALIDTWIFYLAYRRSHDVAEALALGRLAAFAINYALVRRVVFFTKLRNRFVLPPYLALVCLSGVLTYAGIQLLNTQFHIPVLAAKVAAEALLFCASFAIERDLIFGRNPAMPLRDDSDTQWIPRALLAACAIALIGVVWHGLHASPMDAGWTPIGQMRFIRYAKIFWAASFVIWLVLPSAFAPLVVLLITAATAMAIGPVALLAVAGFLVGSCALGSMLIGADDDLKPENQLCATLVGVAVYIFLMTFMARLPVNYPAVYVGLLAAPVLMDMGGVWRRILSWGRALRPVRGRSRIQVAAFALLVFVMGMHWLLVPQPESSADGLAMHLAIPLNISLHHVLTYRPERILWSVMPMGADWCYTIVYLLGGEYAARLLNFAMLLLVEALLYRAARRFVSPAVSYLILALFASTSLVQLVTGSLFVENLLAAMVMGMVTAIWMFGDTGKYRYLYAAAVLGGTTLAIKLGGMAFMAAALPVAIIEARRVWGRDRPRYAATLAVVLLLAAAMPAYIIAWRMTGNPVYPFLNQRFPSPLIDRKASFVDARFRQPLSATTPYDLTFHTDRFGEGRPGSLGFAFLLLAPLGLIALPAVRRLPAWGAAVVAIGGALIILKATPNTRYLYPALPLLLAPLAALFGWLPRSAARVGLAAVAVAVVALNTWFLPASSSYHGNFYEKAPLSRAMRRLVIHEASPIREIGQYMNTEHPGAPVFLATGEDLAAFNADVYTNGWHQYNVSSRLARAHDAGEIAGILEQWKVHYIVAPRADSGAIVKPVALRDMIQKCTAPEFRTKWLFLARLENGCPPAGKANREPLVLSTGMYDDSDPAIVYQGAWIQNRGWEQALGHTISFSNSPGAQVRFAFVGQLFTYTYTKAPNRGMADVTIDGIHKAVLDLYAPQPQWISRTHFKLNAGRHLAVITVLPRNNPKSAGQFVDVDAFEVE